MVNKIRPSGFLLFSLMAPPRLDETLKVSVSLRNKLQIDVGASWDPEMEMDHSQQTPDRETLSKPRARTEMDHPQQTNFDRGHANLADLATPF